jgi:NADH dehydrogenase
LEPEAIAAPMRTVIRKLRNVRFAMEEVRSIHLDAREIETNARIINYDFLVIGLGSSPQFFGVRGAAEHAFVLKNLDEAIALRNHILYRFECALRETEAERRRAMLTFTIIGGGPTGVEFAGALAELIHGPFSRDYRDLDFGEVQILLLEGLPHLLGAMAEKLQAYSAKRLQQMGVTVRLNAKVEEIMRDGVRLATGEFVPTETVVWTAGVRGNPLGGKLGIETARNGQLPVLDTLQLEGYPEVYIAGDLAQFKVDGRGLPMVAPVAIQQGAWAAENIERQLLDEMPLPFRYKDRGTMVTIGRNAAVANAFGYDFTGFVAWVMWLGVHIVNLIGYRNRIVVLVNWAFDYFLTERAIRLILPNEASSPRETNTPAPREAIQVP